MKEFVLIADKWIVKDNTKLDLSGGDLKYVPLKNADGKKDKPEGKDGVGDLAGENGANFYGYAQQVVKGEKLKVILSGGKGGKGQDGSKAFEESPEIDYLLKLKFDKSGSMIDELKRNKFYKYRDIKEKEEQKLSETGSICSYTYTLHARQCCHKDGMAGIGKIFLGFRVSFDEIAGVSRFRWKRRPSGRLRSQQEAGIRASRH